MLDQYERCGLNDEKSRIDIELHARYGGKVNLCIVGYPRGE